jgi:transposase
MKNKGTRAQHHASSNVYRKETTRDERLRIMTLRDDAKMTWKKIQEHTGIDFRTCQSIYARTKSNGTPSNRPRTGRPVVFNAEEKERLRLFISRDKRTRRLMWEDIIQDMGIACSVKTLRDVMASMGYHKRVPRKK